MAWLTVSQIGITICAFAWEAHTVIITQTTHLVALNPKTQLIQTSPMRNANRKLTIRKKECGTQEMSSRLLNNLSPKQSSSECQES